MLDVRLAAMTLATLMALASVCLADTVKYKSPAAANDKPRAASQSSTEVRPIRVILPASWEPSKGQAAESQSTK